MNPDGPRNPDAAVEAVAKAVRHVINSYCPDWDRRIDWSRPDYAEQSLVDARFVLTELEQVRPDPTEVERLANDLAGDWHARALRAEADVAKALAEDGEFDRWMRLQQGDRRNGTTEARDAISRWFEARVSGAPERRSEDHCGDPECEFRCRYPRCMSDASPQDERARVVDEIVARLRRPGGNPGLHSLHLAADLIEREFGAPRTPEPEAER
jgi:hypothetical protein